VLLRWILLFVLWSLPLCQPARAEDRLAAETLLLTSGRPAESLRHQLAALDQQFAADLHLLADQAREADDPAGARWVGAWLPPAPACGERLFVACNLYTPVPGNAAAASTSAEAPAQADAPWRKAWRMLREKMAQQYYQLALEACRQNQVGLALQLATRAVRENPDHLPARRLLGYQRVNESWAGGYAARMASLGRVWDPQYGWIREQNIDRWQAGERPLGRQWISTDQDQKHHRTIGSGWHVRTDHYEIVTNHSRLAAIHLAEKLETVYQIWQQLFGDYSLTSKLLLRRLDGKQGAGQRRRPFQVRYYHSQREYNNQLRHLQPRIDGTLGIYFDSLRQAHFFYGPEQDAGTMYHEGVHQLFQEATGPAQKRTTSQLATQANAWVVEGIACYFESLTSHRVTASSGPEKPAPGKPITGSWNETVATGAATGLRPEYQYFTIGTPPAGRLPAARHRLLVDSFYLPLRQLTALSARQLRRHAQIARLYSQAAGLATFLMHYRGGVYRRPLIRYLQAVYAGRDKPTTLAEVTGQHFEQLDRQYADFLQRLP